MSIGVFYVVIINARQPIFTFKGVQLAKVDSASAKTITAWHFAIRESEIPETYTQPLNRKLAVLLQTFIEYRQNG